MTISSTIRTAGPFNGNGVTTDFPFSYKVFSRNDVLVALTDTATNTETIKTLDADYAVFLNADQNANPGGIIRMTVPPPTGTTLAATSNIALVQSLDLTNLGGFYPKVINDALDRIVMNIQQLSGKIGNGLGIGMAAITEQALAALALVQQIGGNTGASLIGFIQDDPDAVASTVQDEVRRVAVGLEQFKLAVEADWSNATNRACKHCFQTGATLRLQGKSYPGARIEVHGTFDVEGNGATVDFLGVGYTIIAGTGTGTSAVPTAWGTDAAIYNSAAYVPTMYGIASPVAIGDDTITLAGVAGLIAGDTIFLAGNPSSASSNGNYIPASFEYAQILSIAGNVVTLNGKARNTYTTAGAVFKTPGLAKNCRISNLRLKSTGSEAYQLTIRSALGVEIENIDFAGRDTLGSATFVEGLALKNFHTSGAGGNWSFARGTVSALLDGFLFQYCSGMTSEVDAIFIEESCYDISLRSIRSYGGSFSVRQMDMTGAVVRRSITILDSVFDTTNSPGGATSPFQCGNAAGVDIEVINSTLAGAITVPNAGTYPGITGSALCWIASNQTTDKVKFSACHLKSSVSGASFKTGSGALGTILFDELCTYEGCNPPATQYTPRGAWIPLTLSGVFTAIPGYTVPAYRIENNQVYFAGAIQVNAAISGDTLAVLPTTIRPPTSKLLPSGSAQTGTAGSGSVTLGLDTAGNLTARWSTGVAYFGIEGLSYAIDV